jgi:hypothetical protein
MVNLVSFFEVAVYLGVAIGLGALAIGLYFEFAGKTTTRRSRSGQSSEH